MIQETPRTERTPNQIVSITPRMTVHLMEEKSQEPLKKSKLEEDKTLDQDQVEGEELHYTGSQLEQRRFPPRINFESKPAMRVGWVNNDKKKFICYSCYAEGHTSPQCMLKLQQVDEVVTNYEALSNNDHEDLQDNAYNVSKAYLDFKKKAEEEAAEQGNDIPCLLYTSPSPRDQRGSRMPSSA